MIAEFHAKALAEIAGVKLVAAYNRSPAKGRDFAAKHGITFAETPEALLADPAAWAALLTLIALEVVLGVDNLIFIAILSNKLPDHQQERARKLGLMLALVLRSERALLARRTT